MKYKNTVKGIFLNRPNRFIANAEINGEIKVCHVKNTGRCRELLLPGASVILEKSDNPARKTEYDLVAVYKGDVLINIDSVAPNKAFGEWVKTSGYFGKEVFVKPECRYKNSRFDFYVESGERKIFVEVKGVTLEKNGLALFPDAPTERGAKHINELVDAIKNGYSSCIFFVVQMGEIRVFSPNDDMDPKFASALRYAADQGVEVRCVSCKVTEDSMVIADFVETLL